MVNTQNLTNGKSFMLLTMVLELVKIERCAIPDPDTILEHCSPYENGL